MNDELGHDQSSTDDGPTFKDSIPGRGVLSVFGKLLEQFD